MNFNKYALPSTLVGYCCFKNDTNCVDRSRQEFTQFVRQQPNFSIETNSYVVHLLLSRSIQIGTDKTKKVKVILHGEIYQAAENQARYLAESYATYGDIFAKNINGSCSILLIDEEKDRVALITDRINSRRIFVSRYKEGFCISSQFSDQPWDAFKLDLTGIAWYLCNRIIYNLRTLFEEISVFERACIHDLTKKGFKGTKYWNDQYNSSATFLSQKKLGKDLSDLLIKAVERQMYDHPEVFLGLSAGYDATGILGVLAYDLKLPSVHCFSYEHGSPQPGSDAYQSMLMAQKVGYPHQIVESYTGNFIQHLWDNASMGIGRSLSWYCSEIEAWKTMALKFSSRQPSVLFVGNHWFGWDNYSLKCPSDVLTSLQISGFETLFWLETMLRDNIYEIFEKTLAEDLERIINKCPSTYDYYDCLGFLDLDQILSHWILPWRESFASWNVPVRSPLLDNDILEFMTSVPGSLRRNKRLWRYTITRMYPELFSIPRAKTSGNYYINLPKEFNKHSLAIEELIKNQNSRLDEIIPPDVLLRILDKVKENDDFGLSSNATGSTKISKLREKIRRKFRGFFPLKPQKTMVAPSNLLLRLMILRMALSSQVKS